MLYDLSKMDSQNSSEEKGKADSFLVPIPDKKLVCVEYPGKVVNVDRALETLGGEETITQVSRGTNQRLPLHFRPDNIYCKPVFGNKYSTTNMLLKVSKKKVGSTSAAESQPQGPSTSTAADDEYSCEIVGTVDSTFKFEGMCDYQYLPMHRTADGAYRTAIDELVPDRPEDLSFLEKESQGLFMVPSNFSRTDSPSNYIYQTAKDGHDPLLDENLIGKRRKKRPGNAYIVPFDIETIPKDPQEEAMDNCMRNNLTEEVELLRKLFKERPIYTRMSLAVESQITWYLLKLLLPAVAYHFISGPWRTTWCRLGFDPRTDNSSRLYQVVDFRMRKNVLSKAKEVMRPLQPRGLFNVPAKQIRRDKKAAMVTTDAGDSMDSVLPSTNSAKNDHTEANYILKEGLLPAYYQICYQFCDLRVESVQAIITKAEVGAECDPRHGWFAPDLCQMLRDEISRVVERTVVKILQENKGKEPDEGVLTEQEREEAEDEGEEDDDELSDEMDSDNEELLEYLEPLDT